MYRNKRSLFRKCMALLRVTVLLGTLIVTLILSMTMLAQTASARTYVITDGDRVLTYSTFATDPEEVLGMAGLELGAQDSYTTAPVAGGSAITIRRAQTITVKYHGQTMLAASTGETAGELLDRLGLEVAGEDMVSHGMDTETWDGMVLTIDQVVTRRETYTSTIPYEVRRCNDSSLPQGMEEVLMAGVDGELQCVAEVTYRNGQEESRVVLGESVIRPAVVEIIGVGTGVTPEEIDPEAMPIISDGYITLPTGEVLTYYKKDTVEATAYTHTDEGCDLITSTGSTVRWGTVAVDPRYIPYGTRMFIVASDGSYIYGLATAEDCGGDIKRDRMDLYMPTYEQCIQFGRRRCTIYFLG